MIDKLKKIFADSANLSVTVSDFIVSIVETCIEILCCYHAWRIFGHSFLAIAVSAILILLTDAAVCTVQLPFKDLMLIDKEKLSDASKFTNNVMAIVWTLVACLLSYF